MHERINHETLTSHVQAQAALTEIDRILADISAVPGVMIGTLRLPAIKYREYDNLSLERYPVAFRQSPSEQSLLLAIIRELHSDPMRSFRVETDGDDMLRLRK